MITQQTKQINTTFKKHKKQTETSMANKKQENTHKSDKQSNPTQTSKNNHINLQIAKKDRRQGRQPKNAITQRKNNKKT